MHSPVEDAKGSSGRWNALARRPALTAALVVLVVIAQLAMVFEVRLVVQLLGEAGAAKLGAAERILLVAGIFTIGYGLFRMRYACKATYGMMETLFALAFAHETSATWRSDGRTNLLALMSAVYLVVRGLSNVKDGLDERAKAMWVDSRNPLIRFEQAVVAIWLRPGSERPAVADAAPHRSSRPSR